jgi:hypothetical protein
VITDLFASSNPNLNLSAAIAAQGASKKGKNLNEFDGVMEKASNSLDFASVLSQTLDSGFGLESQDSSSSLDSLLKSSESSSPNLSISYQLATSFTSDSFNSSPFVTMSNKSSFQNVAEVSNKKTATVEKDASSQTTQKDEIKEDEKQDDQKEDEVKEEEVDTDKVISENFAQPVLEMENTSEIEVEEVEVASEIEESAKVLEQVEKVEEDTDNVEINTKNVSNDSLEASELLEDSKTTEEVKTVESIENTQKLESTDNNTIESNFSENAESSEGNKEKDSKLDEIVKELKESDSTLPEESLRQKFAEATGLDKQAETENTDTNMNQTDSTNITNQSAQVVVANNSFTEDNQNKDFSNVTVKNESLNAKADQSRIIVGNSEGASNKGFTMNQNNGSGSNSGFSFQSGLSQNYNQNGKISQAPNTPGPTFTEFLNKAEMVQTKDGAKVMNLEVEQDGLGKLELELTSKDGEVTARLSAESDLAKAKIEELAPQIKENLLEKGVNLTQINVDVSSKDADENGDKYLNTGRKNKSRKLDGIKGSSVKEIIEKKVLPNLRRVALNIQSVDLTV